MFYEIKEKRVTNSLQVRWWLTAAFSAVVLTGIFIALIFWLGMNVNKSEVNYTDRHAPYRDFQHSKTSRPTITTTSSPPKVEYPTAEIIKTTIKSKKGRIEMVEVNDKPKIATASTSSSTLKTTSETPTDSIASVEVELNNEEDSYHQTQEQLLRSKIAKLTSAQIEYEAAESSKLEEGVSPLDESSTVSESNSVRKKSEAVPPSWYDPSLQNNQNKPEPSNHLKQQESVYELPDFSQIKPDLSIFNTKTIPAFTYLKEPLPQFDSLPDPDDSSSIIDESYYYQSNTESVPHFGSKETENSFMSLLQRRLRNVQDWLLYGNKKNTSVDLMEVVKAVNHSFHNKNAGVFFSKLKDVYTNFNLSDLQSLPVSNLLFQTSPSILTNSTSLVSFGLLAIDLFLLHNVQQIVWNEETKIGEEMLKDPDVVALNALFMSPDRIQQLRQTKSRILTDNEKKGVVHEVLEFINGGLRAVLNLSKAYKSSTTRSNARSSSSGSPIDCIWTLYCRNLDKTAKLHGPYGFLAKMNSLGLRLMMGEFPVEKTLDKLIKEYNNGWGPLDCDKLFPKCGADEAKEIVIETALGRISV